MDKTKIRNYQIASGIFVCILGTLLHFTYEFFGNNIFVASFFVAVILGEYLAYKLISSDFKCNNIIAGIVLTVVLICFVVFTYFTPNIGLFKDPVTNQYGIIN